MNDTGEKKIRDEMRKALASYTGPVTQCPPGRARASAEAALARNAAVEWLKKNRDARPITDIKAARRQMRMVRARQQRIAKRNAPLLKRANKRRAREPGLNDKRP